MKNVIYSAKESFMLTDAEFEEAIAFWGEGKDYYCMRIKSLLAPRYWACKNLNLQLKYDLFIEVNGGKIHDVARDKRTGIYFDVVEGDDDKEYDVRKITKIIHGVEKALRDSTEDAEQKEFLKTLVPIEDYFNNNGAVESEILIKLK